LWILLACLSLLLLLALVLCLPLDFSFKLNTESIPPLNARLRWIWGLVNLMQLPATKPRSAGERPPHRPGKNKGIPPHTIAKILSIRGLPGQFLKLLHHLMRSLKIINLHLNITASPEDPVTFGYFFAICQPLNYLLSRTAYNININPVFEGQLTLDGRGQGRLRLVPAKLLLHVTAILVSRPCLQFFYILIKNRWQK
jgi:hypothetical protein